MDRGKFVTDRAGIPKGTGKGEDGSRKKMNEDSRCRVYWSKEKDGCPGFGEMSPDVRRSRRVREVIWKYVLYGGTGPSVLEVLLVCGLRIS
ncbi:unnamed protein product, partial [Staurois parvus]